jgi:predicted CoA-binding protein
VEKVTLVLGASSNPERFSYKSIENLRLRNIPVIAIGRRETDMGDWKITKGKPENLGPIHTVTMYMNAKNQEEFYNFILSLKPKRIIFNPGTCNPVLSCMAMNSGIEVVEDCMLVMLNSGRF